MFNKIRIRGGETTGGRWMCIIFKTRRINWVAIAR